MLQFAAILRNRHRKPISESVSELLKARGLGYNEIERRTDGRLNHSFLSKLVSGASANPRLDKLIELADLLDVTVSEVIGDEPVEPEGFRESRLWELFEVYKQIDDKVDRQLADGMVDSVLRASKALLPPKRKADGSKRVEAIRKTK